MSHPETSDKRVCFDFDIAFSNGGGIQGQGFRLDIDGDDISDAQLGEYIVRDLRLLMVGSVRILNKTIINERHKRAADLAARADDAGSAEPVIDLSRHGAAAVVHATAIRLPSAAAVASSIQRLANLEAVVVRLAGMAGRAIDAEALAASDVAGRAVLLQTGHAAAWDTPAYADDPPFLTLDGADYLIRQGVPLVGIDGPAPADSRHPVLTALAAAGVAVVENLADLDDLPNENVVFTAAPVLQHETDQCPVRAWARIGGRR